MTVQSKSSLFNFNNILASLFLIASISACGGGSSDAGPDGGGGGGTLIEFTLTVTVVGEGTVTSSPSGINCGTDCSQDFSQNSTVVLTAEAAAGFEFTGWSGACSGTGTCSVTMGNDQAVTANFEQTTTEVSLSVTKTGQGSVSSTPSGIDCGSDCSQDYALNTQVTLTATPDSGWQFDGWGGACSGNNNCVLTMTETRSVTATFSEIDVGVDEFSLSVTSSGNGTISSSPAGINCGSDCSEVYTAGTVVTLTATPDAGYELQSWSGACSGSGSCQVTMSDNRTVSATFVAVASNYTLTVTSPTNGSVTSSPSGINCGSDCSESYSENTVVTLTATPDSGYEFDSWGGACSGTGSCQVTMDDNKTVSATFTEVASEHTLTVSVTGNGSVTSSPSGINCGNDCEETYAADTQVTLTAAPETGYRLQSWGGDCSGNTSCVVTMDSAQSVTATFVESTTGGNLAIADMGNHEVDHGDTFVFQPQITGTATICRKDLGHDDVRVDSETGQITWDTSGLAFGRGFYIRIKCSNHEESAYASMVVHVDKSGTSRLRVAGEGGVSPYVGVAGRAMTSGDTIVFPDGNYPVSVTRDESFENAYKTNAPTDGTADQFSTIISQTPGGVVINGEPHNGIGKQKNAFQLTTTNYVAIVGFVVKNVQRESLTASNGNRLLIDFVGAQGAGTWGLPCSNFSEADAGGCSNAGMRVNSGSPLFQNSYDWGHNRYGIMTRSTHGSITRRSFVRLDEHRGDQPYGGFSNYCDTLHLSQDNTVFDSLAIAAPHYKNYAGLEAYPATGCENTSAELKTEGLLAVNNKLSLSLMDQKAGPTHVWDHIVSYDSEGTCTPQTNRCGLWLLQADKDVDVTNSFFGKARGFEGSTSISQAFGSNINRISVEIDDVPGEANTNNTPDYLPESLLYFRGRSDTFHGDTGFDQVTTARRYPIPGEDIIAANMRSYYNPDALRVGGGTVVIDGNRGAAASGESMSEFFWGYINDRVPPLVVRVKDKGAIHRVAWEHLSGSRRDDVTGWKVVCVATGSTVLATLDVDELVYDDNSGCASYGVRATYASGDSGIAYTETPQ